MLNDEVLYERQNKYHKPLFSLRHSWRVSDKLYISNMAYASYGYGGGTRLENSLGGGDYTPDGQVDFQSFTTQTPSVVCSDLRLIRRTATRS